MRVAVDESVASFWYNPGTGAVRARVPATVSDQRAVELYNRVNNTSLRSIFEGAAAPQRPVADAVHDRLDTVDEVRPSLRPAKRRAPQHPKPPR
ncbi:MAG: hypothetical protein D6824_06910 [Planctomycetota bacterium]|nr:MAG: hypothetical protein D6824_06910 [Planctomycetota bacterium]